MPVSTRLLVMAALAAVSILALAGPSGANRLSLSETAYRVVFPEATPMGANDWTCPVTLTGSFHSRTLFKTVDTLVGYVTNAAKAAEGCRFSEGASAVTFPLATTLPWHAQYNSIAGVLPRIQSFTLRVIGLSWLVTILGISCLYQSTERSPALGRLEREAGGAITTLTWEEGATIPLSAGVGCPERATLKGTGTVTVPGAATKVTLSLI